MKMPTEGPVPAAHRETHSVPGGISLLHTEQGKVLFCMTNLCKVEDCEKSCLHPEHIC